VSVSAPVADGRPLVLRSQESGVLTLTLNRGERFNPLSLAMVEMLQCELDAIADDASVRVVILAAHGKGFCAGHDLKEMRSHSGDTGWQRRLFEEFEILLRDHEAAEHIIATPLQIEFLARKRRVERGDTGESYLDDLSNRAAQNLGQPVLVNRSKPSASGVRAGGT
jgi:hypothetical protein